jgi:hypothetical protein
MHGVAVPEQVVTGEQTADAAVHPSAVWLSQMAPPTHDLVSVLYEHPTIEAQPGSASKI